MATVLIVDDQPENLYLLKVLLEGHQYAVLQAENGAEALERARMAPPDLVISDVLMPVLDGFALCREWKSDPRLKTIPFVIYTATYTDAQDERLALDLGADLFLVKPADPVAFIQTIGELLDTHAIGEIQPRSPAAGVEMVLQEHNQALLRKLESKMDELEEANRTLKASQERYYSLFQHVPVGLYMSNMNGQIVEVNEALVRLLGYPSAAALRAASTESLFPNPDARAQWLKRLSGSAELVDAEVRIRRYDGRVIWVKESARAIPAGPGGEPLYEGAVVDITERRESLERIQRHVQFLNSLRRIDTMITNRLDLPETLQLILSEVVTQLKVEAAAILLLDRAAADLEMLAWIGFPQAARGGDRRVSMDRAMEESVLHQHRPVTRLGAPAGRRMARLAGVSAGIEDVQFYVAAPLIVSGEVIGVLELFDRGLPQAGEEWYEYLSALTTQAAVGMDNRLLFQKEQRAYEELKQTYRATLDGWSRLLDLRDRETEGHTRRVVRMTLDLALAMGVPEAELEQVRQGALLHDIGKMGVPDHILLKAGPLTAEEWQVMRKHPTYAYEMLRAIEYLKPALVIPHCHHEHFDGSGYPNGLKGEAIPLWARIFAVVDVYEALTSDRPYRPAWPHAKAVDYIKHQAGLQFDPAVVERFLGMIQKENG